MKRRDVVRRITQAAKAQGIVWKVEREGANHTIYLLGRTRIQSLATPKSASCSSARSSSRRRQS